MKKIMTILFCGIATLTVLTSCEGKLDYSTTMDAAAPLAYIYAGDNNQGATTVVHTPAASINDFSLVLPVKCNLLAPNDAKISVKYDMAAAAVFIAEKGLDAVLLPKANICIRKYESGSEEPAASNTQLTLSLPAGTQKTTDSLSVVLCGDLSTLQKEEYVFALSISSDDIAVSETLGQYYLTVNTVTRNIKPIKSTSEIGGSLPSDRKNFKITAPAGVSSASNLFDNKTNTYGSFPSAPTHDVIVDMLSVRSLAGWGFSTGSSRNQFYYEFEYSVDGVKFESFGPCTSSDQYKSSNNYYFGLYAPIQARYFKFKTKFPNYATSSNYRRYAELYFYTVQ